MPNTHSISGGGRIDLPSMGKRIKSLRQKNSMKQAYLASRLGISVQYISALENGRKQPSLEMLVKLARELNTTTDDLLCLPTPDSNPAEADRREIEDLFGSASPSEKSFYIEVMKAAKEYLRGK